MSAAAPAAARPTLRATFWLVLFLAAVGWYLWNGAMFLWDLIGVLLDRPAEPFFGAYALMYAFLLWLVALWVGPVFLRIPKAPALGLTADEAPALYRALEEALARAGVPGKLQLELTPDASMRLAPPTSFFQALMGTPRRVRIGLVALEALSEAELAGLVAATAAGWGGREDQGAGWVRRISEGFDMLGHAYGTSGCLQWPNPLFWLSAAIAQGLSNPKVVGAAVRERPFVADSFGVRATDPATYASALRRAAITQAVFETTANLAVFDKLEEGEELANLFEMARELDASLPEAPRAVLASESLESADPESGVPLGERLARFQSTDQAPASPPASGLLPDLPALEVALTRLLIEHLDRSMQTARDEAYQQHLMDVRTMQDEYERRKR